MHESAQAQDFCRIAFTHIYLLNNVAKTYLKLTHTTSKKPKKSPRKERKENPISTVFKSD